MKREKSKAKKFDILHFVADNAGLSTFEAIEKAYNMGVSEQESVLDKIKAEIAKRTIEQGFHADEWSISYDELMKIIDKYKGESEG